MAQPIKYWDTEIDAVQSASEVMALLVRYGASQTSIDWDNGQPTGITFVIHDKKRGNLPIRLPARVDAVVALLKKEKPFTRGDSAEYEQRLHARARRVIWRHLKDLVEQQMLAVRIGQFELVEMFFHGVEVRTIEGTRTMGAWMSQALEAGNLFQRDERGTLMLPAPPREGE